jgi:hypothetical protein
VTEIAAVALQNPIPQSSVELSQTAKGGTQACVKIYGPDPERAMLEAIRLYDLLVAKYAPPGTAA